jgi:calcineurin-like phosphoesterase family protein
MGKDWVSADFHLGHANILKHCHRTAFMTAEEVASTYKGGGRISDATLRVHDDAILDATNRLVSPGDRLFILGDFCWPGRDGPVYKTYADYRNRIQCNQVILIWGNHDPKHNSAGRALVAKCFYQALDNLSLRIGEHSYFLSHYAHAIWDKRHYGSRHLYGHSHGRAEEWLDSVMPGRYSMDVGIDNAYRLMGEYRPFSFEEIEGIMSQRPGFGLLRGRDED